MYQTIKRKFLFLILIFFSFLYPFFGQQVLSNLNTSWTNVLPGSVITSPALTSYGFCLISDARLISAFTYEGKTLWEKPCSRSRDVILSSLPGDFIALIDNSSKTIKILNPSGGEIWSKKLNYRVLQEPFAGRDGRFFIKGDDVEYGLRIKPKIVLTNGIGVWHMAFQEKYSTHLEYYIKRNELVVSTIHDRRMTAFSAVWKLVRAYGKAVLVSDVRNIPFLLKAYRDFLKGPDFLMTTEEEKLNAALLAMKKRPAPKRLWCLLTAPFQMLAVLIPFSHGYSAIQEQYIQRIPELTSMEFWTRHLGIAEEDNKDGVF